MLMTEGNPRGDADAILAEAANASSISRPSLPSFHAIYAQYFDFVWSLARHLGAAADAIDDVVQDVFIVIHSRLSTLQNPGAMRSWIYGIVRRTVSDHRRSRRNRDAAGARFGAELKASGYAQPSPLDLTERNAELDLLEAILAELDPPKREIFVMVEVLEMTIPEVVQALEMPLNTAYSRLRLARKLFDEALARREAGNQENGD
jgi:RNA polymerase sigma-70 factor (ECF subfamily)